ncbi:MAG TPA: nuclear transport factor 2 family protein [Caulobacteraceae bacterium]
MSKLSIEDRLALQDLMAAYAWALDTGDVEGLVAVFTADCLMKEEVFDDPDIWEGHEGIRGLADHYFNAPGFPGRQHHTTQVQYTPKDDGSVDIRSFAFVTECEGEPPYVLRFAGYYEDTAVRDTDGEWRFKVRAVRLWDGAVLKNFPGRGTWVPRQRPPSLMRKQGSPG